MLNETYSVIFKHVGLTTSNCPFWGYKIASYLHNVCNLLTYNSCHFVTLNQSQEKTSSCDKAAFTLCDAENVMQNIESSLLCMTKLS